MKQKFSLLAAIACICGGGRVANAQLIISVYPSQDNPTNQTLWIFSGSSTARASSSIRSSTTSLSFSYRDIWEIGNLQNIYATNASSSGEILPLSPLLSSANTKDINSILSRIPGGGKTDITFSSNATNRPGIIIGSSYRDISRIYMERLQPRPELCR